MDNKTRDMNYDHEILQLAYGENIDPAALRHIRECASCRQALAENHAVRAAAAAGLDRASESSVSAILKKASPTPKRTRFQVRLPLYASLAAAALVAALVVARPWTREPEPALSEPPLYLTSLDTGLAELDENISDAHAQVIGALDHETQISWTTVDDDADEDSTEKEDDPLDVVLENALALSELEMSMADLEYGMGLTNSEDYLE